MNDVVLPNHDIEFTMVSMLENFDHFVILTGVHKNHIQI